MAAHYNYLWNYCNFGSDYDGRDCVVETEFQCRRN